MAPTGTPISISVDTTVWSTQQRHQLLDFIAEIDSAAAAAALPEFGEVEATGWTFELYQEVISELLSKYHVQVSAIFEAIKAGTGYVDRPAVYALGGYPADRTLKGFTRPVNRAVLKLVEAGRLPEDAPDLLAPVYDPSVSGYQRTKGFQVPLEVVKLALDHKAQAIS
jgi:hypothetical protein